MGEDPNKEPLDHRKPTILAFHGSGSNVFCHRVQLARLNQKINKEFNIYYVQGTCHHHYFYMYFAIPIPPQNSILEVDIKLTRQAPFRSPAGPGILPYFEGCGPYYRWVHTPVSISEMAKGTSSNALAPEVEILVRSIVLKIRSAGGRVVGLLGFSQGTKVVAGLLRASELRDKTCAETEYLDFAFGISICGSFAPPLFPQSVAGLVRAEGRVEELKGKICIPTFHVLGNQDQWKWAGKTLIEGYFEEDEGLSVVREWEQGHVHPVQKEDNDELARWMVTTMKKAGAQ